MDEKDLEKKWKEDPDASTKDIILIESQESKDVFDDEEDIYEEFDNSSSYGQQYDLPESKDGFIDTSTGNVIDRENLTPWEIIKAIAAQTNTKIKDPRNGCKHCYGRGWVGVDSATKSPIPCNCIYPDKTEAEKMGEAIYDSNKVNGVINRVHRRNIQKGFKKQLRQYKKIMKRRELRGFYNSPDGTETSATESIDQEG